MVNKQNNEGRGAKRSPLYQQTAEALEGILAKAEPGSFLPSEPALAKQLGISRATLREAMRTFEERGLIVRKQGVGTFVTQPPQIIETGLERLESLETQAARLNLDVKMGKIDISRRKPSKSEAKTLEIEQDRALVEVRRVILTDGRPVAYLVDAVLDEMLPEDVLSPEFQGSVLDSFLKRGDPPLGLSKTEITAVSASAEVARMLSIQRGDVLLCLEAYLFSKEGRAIDHSLSYFLPGVFKFHVLRRVGG